MFAALPHLRVVELSDQPSAAYCARQFAAWGADVVVVEPPTGSPLRRLPPVIEPAQGNPTSLLWDYVAAGKRSVTLDTARDVGLDELRRLIRRADLLVTDWPPDRLSAAALSYGRLADENPRLISVSITLFGRKGPYAELPATDLTVQALSGLLSLSGYPDRYPLKAAANILPYATGVVGFIGALGAVHERRSSGRGQTVEVSALEAVASLVLFLRAQYFGAPFPRRSGVSTMLLPCADGYVMCSPHWDRGWSDLLVALGVDAADVPEPLGSVEGRQDEAALLAFLAPHAKRRAAKELFETLGALGAAPSLLQTPADLPQNDHLRERGFFRELDHPRLGRLKFPGPAGRMSKTPMGAPSPAPEMGEAAPSAIWCEEPARPEPTAPDQPKESRPPLAGLRVLDLTGAWIGPYAAILLADMGADVVKIESPRRPDVWRGYRPGAAVRFQPPLVARAGAHPWNLSHYYNSVNRNKRSLALDLASPKGRDIFLALAAKADIVMENFTPRVMDNFGLGPETLCAVNPRLVMTSFSGYGKTGPYRDFRANGATTETIGGWVSLFGYPGEPPMLMGEMEADPISGLQMAAHTLVALEHREQTGAGQSIDGSMFEAAVGYIGEELLLAGLGVDLPHPRGNRERHFAPQGVFPVRGPDNWIAISVRDDQEWQALVAVARDAGLDDPRFETVQGRIACTDEIERRLCQWTSRHDGRELMSMLLAAGIPAGVVLKTDQVADDPHMKARGWLRPLDHPDTGESLHSGHVWRFSRSPLVWWLPPPRLGQHSAEVLTSELAISVEDYEGLVSEGVTDCITEWREQ